MKPSSQLGEEDVQAVCQSLSKEGLLEYLQKQLPFLHCYNIEAKSKGQQHFLSLSCAASTQEELETIKDAVESKQVDKVLTYFFTEKNITSPKCEACDWKVDLKGFKFDYGKGIAHFNRESDTDR